MKIYHFKRLGQNLKTAFFSVRKMLFFAVHKIDFHSRDAFHGRGLSL
jgi:hypothetical protein